MRDKEATREDYIPADALKLLGEDGLRLITHKINNIRETGEWPKDFIEFTMSVLEEKSKATKCRDYHTISFTVHTAKTVARISQKGFKGKLRMYLEISLDFEEERN
jgi:hypothetical protein